MGLGLPGWGWDTRAGLRVRVRVRVVGLRVGDQCGPEGMGLRVCESVRVSV